MLRVRNEPICWNSDTSQYSEYISSGYMEKMDFFNRKEIQYAHIESMSFKSNFEGDGIIMEDDNKSVRSIFGIQDSNHRLVDLLCTDKLINLAEEVLDSEVYIHQFHINYKYAYTGGGFFWHSDYTYWNWEDGMPAPRAVSMVIPLTSMRYENGPLFVHRGSHMYHGHDSFYRPTQNSTEVEIKHDEHDPGCATEEQLIMLHDDINSTAMHAILGEPGSLCMMDANLLHMSMPNWSPIDRVCAFVCLNSTKNTLQKPPSGRNHRPQFITNRNVEPLI
jgi:ectoine hydroxylase